MRISTLRSIHFVIYAVAVGMAFSACLRAKAPNPMIAVSEALDVYYQGEELLRAGDLDAAKAQFESSIDISARPIVRWRLAQIYVERNEFDLARQQLDLALEENPSFFQAQQEIERIAAKISVIETLDSQETKETGPETEQKGQTILPPFVMAGGAVTNPGLPMPEALASDAAVESKPTPTPIPDYLTPEQVDEINQIIKEAEFLDFSNLPDDAIKRYRDVLVIDPQRSDILQRIGTIFLKTGRYQQAVVEFREATVKDPENASAFNNMGVAYDNLGEIEPAIWAYKKAIETGEHLDAYYNLGVILEKTAQWEEAIEAYRAYVDRDPNSEWGKKAKARETALERAVY